MWPCTHNSAVTNTLWHFWQAAVPKKLPSILHNLKIHLMSAHLAGTYILFRLFIGSSMTLDSASQTLSCPLLQLLNRAGFFQSSLSLKEKWPIVNQASLTAWEGKGVDDHVLQLCRATCRLVTEDRGSLLGSEGQGSVQNFVGSGQATVVYVQPTKRGTTRGGWMGHPNIELWHRRLLVASLSHRQPALFWGFFKA